MLPTSARSTSGSYDVAVITKDASGRVHVNQDEMATRHGGLGGIAAGAVIGRAKLANVPLNADRHLGKVIDVSSKDLDAAVKEAASEVS